MDGKVIMRNRFDVDRAQKLNADLIETQDFPAGTTHAIIDGWKSITLNEAEAERYNQWVDALIAEGKCAEEIAEESLRYALEILKKYNVTVPLSNKLKSLYAPEMA